MYSRKIYLQNLGRKGYVPISFDADSSVSTYLSEELSAEWIGFGRSRQSPDALIPVINAHGTQNILVTER